MSLYANSRGLILAICCAAASACGSPSAPDHSGRAALDQLQSAIVQSTGYSSGTVEVLGNAVRVRVSINDRELARADHLIRERVIDTVLATIEKSIAQDARLASVNEISVTIVHPEAAHGLLQSTHSEDAVEFRKGPDQKFYRDVL